ncbi:MAG: hypothetical protein ABI638_05705 [Ignavibacteriota bacterium]
MDKNGILSALEPVFKALDESSIGYFIGGSIASSAYGIARATMDVDMILNIAPFQVKSFFDKLKGKYYIDIEIINDALVNKSSFNILHLDSMLKIDFFILKDQTYPLNAFQRRIQSSLDDSDDSVKVFLCSPEDIIISKLEWFKLSDESSERQWSDILGVVKVQKNNLDKEYLKHWAIQLDLFNLLQKAFEQSEESL